MEHKELSMAIVGGGIGGLSAALSLLQAMASEDFSALGSVMSPRAPMRMA